MVRQTRQFGATEPCRQTLTGKLKDVRVGQTIDVYTQRGRSRYVVDEIQIVSPGDVSVLVPRAEPSLTLVTCYPFYFVGTAPSRYIVHATLAAADDLRSSEMPGQAAKALTLIKWREQATPLLECLGDLPTNTLEKERSFRSLCSHGQETIIQEEVTRLIESSGPRT